MLLFLPPDIYMCLSSPSNLLRTKNSVSTPNLKKTHQKINKRVTKTSIHKLYEPHKITPTSNGSSISKKVTLS